MMLTLALTAFLILVSASFAKAVDAPIAIDTECSEFINSIEAKYKYGWIQVAETQRIFCWTNVKHQFSSATVT